MFRIVKSSPPVRNRFFDDKTRHTIQEHFPPGPVSCVPGRLRKVIIDTDSFHDIKCSIPFGP